MGEGALGDAPVRLVPAGELCHFPLLMKHGAGEGQPSQPVSRSCSAGAKPQEHWGGSLLFSPPRGCLGLCFPLPSYPASRISPLRLSQSAVRAVSMPPLVSVRTRFILSQELPSATQL